MGFFDIFKNKKKKDEEATGFYNTEETYFQISSDDSGQEVRVDAKGRLCEGVVLNGRYRIERILGQGGGGITYLAHDKNTNRQVAIKEFFPKQFCGRDSTTGQVKSKDDTDQLMSDLKRKFYKEALTIAKFNHPYVITNHEVFDANGTVYYVMDFVDGRSLHEIVKTGGPLSLDKALEYIAKAGIGLEYVHSLSIAHFDIKPLNIMVRRSDDSPVLIDFGISKHYDEEGKNTSFSDPGRSAGYSPLELYSQKGVETFSPQSDVYSLGATLYYLLSGTTPPVATELVECQLTFPPKFPASLTAPITKAMRPNRKDRYPTIHDFVTAILPDYAKYAPKAASQESPEKLYQKGQEANDIGRYEEAVRLYRIAAEQGYAPAQCKLGWHYRHWYYGVNRDYKEAVKWYQKATEQGSTEAPYELGYMYEFGVEGEIAIDITEAIRWYRKGADQGGAKSQYSLGRMYYQGKGVIQDYKKAVLFLRKAADQGNSSAQCKLGWCYHYGQGVSQDDKEAVKWFRKAADQENYEALKALEQIDVSTHPIKETLEETFQKGLQAYNIGRYEEAVRLYRIAAEQGHVKAQKNLGGMYQYGRGIPQNYNEAVKWYQKAAEQGDAYMQMVLGYLYYNGIGVVQNYDKAKLWYQKAADQGNSDAKRTLEQIDALTKTKSAPKETPEEIYQKGQIAYKKRNYKEAARLYRIAAEHGHAEAQYYLGYLYDSGTGVAKDVTEATKWLQKAVDQGFVLAKNPLQRIIADSQPNTYVQKSPEEIYQKGLKEYNEGNYKGAVRLYRIAAEQGHLDAQCSLALMYYSGRGIPQDYEGALKWWRKAADKGNACAQYNIGVLYECGRGVIMDKHEAEKWYRKAAEQGYEKAKISLQRLGVK